jgi:hypothetical protein
MICKPSFIKIGSSIQTLIGMDTQTHGDITVLLSFFHNKKSGIKIITKSFAAYNYFKSFSRNKFL